MDDSDLRTADRAWIARAHRTNSKWLSARLEQESVFEEPLLSRQDNPSPTAAGSIRAPTDTKVRVSGERRPDAGDRREERAGGAIKKTIKAVCQRVLKAESWTDLTCDVTGSKKFALRCGTCQQPLWTPRVFSQFQAEKLFSWTEAGIGRRLGDAQFQTLLFADSESDTTTSSSNKKHSRKRRRSGLAAAAALPHPLRRRGKLQQAVAAAGAAASAPGGDVVADTKATSLDFVPSGAVEMTFSEFRTSTETRYIRWSLPGGSRRRPPGSHSGTVPKCLASDLPLPDKICSPGELIDCVVRLGTPRYRYREHSDWAWNCLVQVAGVKLVTLRPPNDGSSGVPFRCACSRGAGVGRDERCSVSLKPGQVLIIPPNWRHKVASKSDGVAVSVNYFWSETSASSS